MFCSKCGANVPDNATFCSACGQPTGGLPVAPAGSVAVAARPSVQYAGFWLRFVAFIIDAIVLGVCGFHSSLCPSSPRWVSVVSCAGAPMSPDELMPFFSAIFGELH